MSLELIFIFVFLVIGYSIFHKSIKRYFTKRRNEELEDDEEEDEYSSDSDNEYLHQVNEEMGYSRRSIVRQRRRERKEMMRERKRHQSREYRRQRKREERRKRKYEEKQRMRKDKEEEEKKKKNEKSQKEFENWAHLFETVQSGKSKKKEKLNVNEFVSLVKNEKVVNLETLSLKFSIPTITAVVERINILEKEGLLSGVFDERGKYIFIGREELEGIAHSIRVKGRVTTEEILETVNNVINKKTELKQ